MIAKWYNNKAAAVSLRFDDSLESHVKTVIPLLNKYGMKATFMINPGRDRYKKNKAFWEKEVPKMGYDLGDHTMNHRGAKNLKEAEYEIGEPAKLIWSLYPHKSKLLVFASGGGNVKWGGKSWEVAPNGYKKIVKKYHLIDLYDGNHPSIAYRSNIAVHQLCEYIQQAIKEKKHQPFHFHNVGSAGLIDYLKSIRYGYNWTISENNFLEFIKCVDKVKEHIWLDTLVQVLKYEEEYKNSEIKIVEENEKIKEFKLITTIDPTLYDQKLTIIIPLIQSKKIKKVLQDNDIIEDITITEQKALLNIKPINSKVIIYYQ